MNTSRFFLGALLLWAPTVLAQPAQRVEKGLPLPLITPEQANHLFLAEKPISLHLRDVKFEAALQELQHQSGVRIDIDGTGYRNILDKKLSIDIETSSFWEAFHAVQKAAGVHARLDKSSGRRNWMLQFNLDDDYGDVAMSGQVPFEIRALDVNTTLSKSITTGRTPRRDKDEEMSVTLFVQPEPQIPIVSTPFIRITRAEDDRGHSLKQDDDAPPSYLSLSDQNQIEVDLNPATAGSQKIAHLEGVATYVIPVKYEDWKVSDVVNARNAAHEFQSAGQTIRVSLRDIQLTANQLQITISVVSLPTGPAGTKIGSPLLSANQLLGSCLLRDATGREFVAGSHDASGEQEKLTVQTTFHLPEAPDEFTAPQPQLPISLLLHAPTEFVQTQMPFSFSNLSLP